MSRRALVLGGTGHVGSAVVKALRAESVETAFTWHQSESKAAELGGPHHQLDLTDETAINRDQPSTWASPLGERRDGHQNCRFLVGPLREPARSVLTFGSLPPYDRAHGSRRSVPTPRRFR